MTTSDFPKYRNRGGIHQFDFANGTYVKVDRISTSRNEIKADIRITTETPGEASHVHFSRPNLLTPQGRKSVIDSCRQRIPELDWDTMIELVCVNVIDTVRAGEQVIALSHQGIRENLPWRAYPFLRDGEVSLFFGRGGSLKTWLAVRTAVIIALGLYGAEPGPVLILDWEADEHEWRERVAMMCAGLGVSIPENIYYRYCSQAFADEQEQIESIVHERGVQFVILDSAAYACGGEAEKADATMRFFSALRTLRITSLIIGHQTNENDTRRPFGSVFWTNSARSVWQVKAQQDPGKQSVEVGLIHRKVNSGRLEKPLGYRVKFEQRDTWRYTDGDKITFEVAKASQMPEVVAGLSVREQIDAAIEHGALRPEAIAEEIEVSVPTVRMTLNRYKSHYVKLPDGSWGKIASNQS